MGGHQRRRFNGRALPHFRKNRQLLASFGRTFHADGQRRADRLARERYELVLR